MGAQKNSLIRPDDSERVRILHLEDSSADADLIHCIMEREGLHCAITLAPDRAAFEQGLLQKQFDLIICDHGIPDYDGFAALRFAKKVQPLVPVIMLSGMLDDAQAVESLKSGATDYILKQRLARLVPAIRRALQEVREHAEKVNLEAAFLRAQRMESIGALASGIAHDLNNALAPVLMSAEVLRDCDDPQDRKRFLDIITSSAQRAGGMVKQVLGFARGNRGTGPMVMNKLMREMGKMVQDTFPKSIAQSVETGEGDLWQVEGDVTEVHQVLLNLCVNARDAMPNGGKLTLGARNFRLDPEAADNFKVAPGPYVLLSVGDTGTGIPPEVLPRLFEPFFTTKASDKGTGLGLSTVASIVKKHKGFVDVSTELGAGTEFRIYLPAIEAPEEIPAEPEQADLPVGHGQLILIIEDEETLRELTKTTLENYGYRVITAQDGMQGVLRFEENKNEVRALVTDTDMPYMDGMAAVRAIKALKPDLPVIIASGSKRNPDDLRGLDTARVANLGKPFSVEQLLIALGIVTQD